MTPRAFVRTLRDAAADLPAALRQALTPAAREAERASKLAATTAPRVRSGALRASIRARILASADGIGVALASPLAYAQAQEEGGTIRGRNGGMLAVPLPNARNPNGTTRAEYAVPLRSVPGLFLIRSKAGNLILARKGPDGLVPLFVLKPAVRLRGRRYLRRGAEAAAALAPEAATAAVARLMRGPRG